MESEETEPKLKGKGPLVKSVPQLPAFLQPTAHWKPAAEVCVSETSREQAALRHQKEEECIHVLARHPHVLCVVRYQSALGIFRRRPASKLKSMIREQLRLLPRWTSWKVGKEREMPGKGEVKGESGT